MRYHVELTEKIREYNPLKIERKLQIAYITDKLNNVNHFNQNFTLSTMVPQIFKA